MDNNHPQVNFGKTGVLLINLGTPDSTGWWDIRKYLNEFLSDRRVIEVNPFLWKIILNLFILTFRLYSIFIRYHITIARSLKILQFVHFSHFL